jgi:putative FmdB family regulatory protein
MPTYEYECGACGHRFERFQKITDDPIEECPECAGPVSRLVGGGITMIFKGSGFYATDYKRTATECGRQTPCCGRETPCEKKPCD